MSKPHKKLHAPKKVKAEHLMANYDGVSMWLTLTRKQLACQCRLASKWNMYRYRKPSQILMYIHSMQQSDCSVCVNMPWLLSVNRDTLAWPSDKIVYSMQKKSMTLNLYTSDAIVLTTVSQVTMDMTIWDQSNDGGFVSDVYHSVWPLVMQSRSSMRTP